uniref:Uncharacterized protein n=1 Tax=Oryza brachyantha TaxID=4533 RepID=J3LPK4_ORYBR
MVDSGDSSGGSVCKASVTAHYENYDYRHENPLKIIIIMLHGVMVLVISTIISTLIAGAASTRVGSTVVE